MKISLPLALTVAAALPAAAQLAAQTKPAAPSAAAKPAAAGAAHPVHAAAAAAAPACAKTPELSPKVPSLPADAPCAKTLMKFTITPQARLDYVSPMVAPEIIEQLGVLPQSFSLDYVDTKVGDGPLAAPHMYYTLQYTGYLLDGTKFDSSLDRPDPFTFPVGQHKVIAGWDLGFQGMHVGGKRRLFIPYQLAYGDKAQGQITPKSELIFDIELLSQSAEEPKKPAPPAPPTPPPAAAPAPGATPAAKPMADPTKPTAAPAPAGAPPATPAKP